MPGNERLPGQDQGKSPELVLHPRYAIWYRLLTVTPEVASVGIPILERVCQDPKIKRVIFFGAPGIGKSILVGQLAELVKIQGIGVSRVHFDKAVTALEAKIAKSNPARPSRSTWGQHEWSSLSTLLYEAIGEQQTAYANEEGRNLQIIEMSAMGDQESMDRAITTLYRLVVDSQQDHDTLVIGVPADPRIQIRRALAMRNYFSQVQLISSEKQGEQARTLFWVDPETGVKTRFEVAWVRRLLAKKFNTYILWLYTQRPQSPEAEGVALLSLISQMAQSGGINRINREVEEQVLSLLRSQDNGQEELTKLTEVLIQADPSLAQESEMAQVYARNVYHMLHRVNRLKRLGLSENLAFTVLNLYSNERVYWPL